MHGTYARKIFSQANNSGNELRLYISIYSQTMLIGLNIWRASRYSVD